MIVEKKFNSIVGLANHYYEEKKFCKTYPKSNLNNKIPIKH